MAYNLNFLRLPEPYTDNNIDYLGPKAERSFSRKLFLTSMVQWRSLRHHLNVYTRLQWRFRPFSDLYLIYSGNRDTEWGQPLNRNLVLKAQVWFQGQP